MSSVADLLHATGVVIGGRCVLLTGPSGAGKSDLALRLIDRGARLLADDYVELHPDDGRLIARAPLTTRGMIEVRGIGIIEMGHVDEAPVALIVELAESPSRLPEPLTCQRLGVAIPVVALAALEVSAPIKVEAALRRFGLALDYPPR